MAVGIASGVKGVALGVKGVASGVKGVASGVNKGVASGVKGVASGVNKGVVSGAKGVASGVKGVASGVNKGVVLGAKGVASGVKGVVSEVKGAVLGAKGVDSGGKTVVSDVKGVDADVKGMDLDAMAEAAEKRSLPDRFFELSPILHVEICFVLMWVVSKYSRFYDLVTYMFTLAFISLYLHRVMVPSTVRNKELVMTNELVRREKRTQALTHEGSESATWLNVLLCSLWPNLIEPAVSKSVCDLVQYYLDYPDYKKYFAGLVGDLDFDLTLGQRPPLVRSARSYLVAPDGVELEWNIDFTTAEEGMRAAVNMKANEKTLLLLNKLQVRGKLLVRFSRITNGGAYVGGIRIAFDQLPMFDVKIKPFDQIDLTNTLGINQVVSKFVGQILGSVITEPNPLVLDIDQWDSYKPKDLAEHVATVELEVLRAFDLKAVKSKKKISTFGENLLGNLLPGDNSTDPFVEIRCGKGNSKVRTKMKDKTSTPTWNEKFEFKLTATDNKVIIFHVKDYNALKEDGDMGDAVIRLDEFKEGEFHRKELDLTDVVQGTLVVRFRFVSLVNKLAAIITKSPKQ